MISFEKEHTLEAITLDGCTCTIYKRFQSINDVSLLYRDQLRKVNTLYLLTQ